MEDSGSRLLTRQDFPHLTDAHWVTLENMVSLLGEAAFAGFPNLSAEQQKARVERFDKYESSLVALGSAAAQEAARAAMRAEAQSAAQASATNSASFAARPTSQDVSSDVQRQRLRQSRVLGSRDRDRAKRWSDLRHASSGGVRAVQSWRARTRMGHGP
ncbi:unnamed protein product [Phytophthora fragariaefolia]|uniref:Unnamed protein product n=1 Tax=Phytophthora fragariaefolia TaxID=1490495 RepID=A0A9W6TTF9_9STRA|nr:unnamed protein product [Phytophthora fragariaefolia]